MTYPDGAQPGMTDELDRILTEALEEMAKNPPPPPDRSWAEPRGYLVRRVNRSGRKKQIQQLKEKGRKRGWDL